MICVYRASPFRVIGVPLIVFGFCLAAFPGLTNLRLAITICLSAISWILAVVLYSVRVTNAEVSGPNAQNLLTKERIPRSQLNFEALRIVEGEPATILESRDGAASISLFSLSKKSKIRLTDSLRDWEQTFDRN